MVLSNIFIRIRIINQINYAIYILSKVIKSPQGKTILYGAKIAYPYVETGSANIARAKVTYNETCKRKK